MSRIARTTVMAALLAGCLAFPQPARVQVSTDVTYRVIEGGTLIDGRGGAAVKDSIVVIRGNRITAVGKRGSVSVPKNAQIIKVDGKYVLPGLIDEHVHYAEWNGDLFLAHGVTTVKDTGNPVEWLEELSKAIETGRTAGPRLFYTGNSLTSRALPTKDHHIGLPDGKTGREAIRILKAHGSVAGKVHQQITPELLAAITGEAHKFGMPVTGHLRRIGAREAAFAGIDGLEHSSGVPRSTGPHPEFLKTDDPENDLVGYYDDLNEAAEMQEQKFAPLIKLLVARKVAIIPTMITWFRVASSHRAEYARDDATYAAIPELRYVPGYVRKMWEDSAIYEPPNQTDEERFKTAYRKMSRFLKMFHDAGGKLYAGSATSVMVPGRSLQREMGLMVELGLTPGEVIRMTTLGNAEFLRKDKEIGSISVGKLADIIVVDADPLVKIDNIQRIAVVIKDGKVIDTKYRADYPMPVPRPKLTRPVWLERQLKLGLNLGWPKQWRDEQSDVRRRSAE